MESLSVIYVKDIDQRTFTGKGKGYGFGHDHHDGSGSGAISCYSYGSGPVYGYCDGNAYDDGDNFRVSYGKGSSSDSGNGTIEGNSFGLGQCHGSGNNDCSGCSGDGYDENERFIKIIPIK